VTGQETGSSCGEVTDLNVESGGALGGLFTTKIKHLGKMRNCAPETGDSGGPVFKRGVAYGLVSGTSGCDVYFQGAVTAQNVLNVDILTR
jgi:trypsin